MRRVRRANTEPEQIVRRVLWDIGARYRLQVSDLPGSPDIANKTRHLAIFVHGCFWHFHEECGRGTIPTRNHEFWAEKFHANRARDRRKVEDPDVEELEALFDQIWLQSDLWPLLSERREEVRVADLFAGCGGMTLGVWEACRALGIGMASVLAVDSDPVALEVFEENLEPEETDTQAVEELLDGELGDDPTPRERELLDRVGDVTILVAGPPCQGHSDSSVRNGRLRGRFSEPPK